MIKLDKNNREKFINLIVSTLNEKEKDEFRNIFLELHSSDQADVFNTFNEEARSLVYTYLSAEEFAPIFRHLTLQDQKIIFLEMNEKYASRMFNYLYTDEAVQFLTGIDGTRAEELLQQMDDHKASEIKAILSYSHETAGAIMTKELVVIESDKKAIDVLEAMREKALNAEMIYYVYVTDEEEKLVGVVSLRDLIIAKPDTPIVDVMRRRVISVPVDMPQNRIGKIIKKYDLLAVPVVSEDNHPLGIVTVDDVMDIIEAETSEDFGKFSAMSGATDINMNAFTAAKKRSPWIIALMFLGLITGGVIGRFEDTLESIVLLAAFIPMIMDSGGNVGTQSLAVSVRGLALGTIEKNSFWRMIKREFLTGAMIGTCCMILVVALVTIIYGQVMLGVIVGVSILCTLSISAVVGVVIPLLIDKLKFDPAIASGPFITTLNDIVGLLIYFSIATYLIEYL